MRMRKLGEGQSVAFCSSTEIRNKIRDHSGEGKRRIEVTDVLEWCIANTCTYSRKSIPLWATQYVLFCLEICLDLGVENLILRVLIPNPEPF